MNSVKYDISKLLRINTKEELLSHHKLLWIHHIQFYVWQEYEVVDYRERFDELDLKILADSEEPQKVGHVFTVDMHDMLNRWRVYPMPIVQYNNLWLSINDT